MRRPLKAASLAASTLALAACAVHRSDDSGPESSRAFPVASFSAIEVAGPYSVRVHNGPRAAVSATGPEKILDRLEVKVVGGELQIGSKNNHRFGGGFRLRTRKPVVIDVTTPSLDRATIAGSGDIAADQVRGASFAGAVAGSGSLSIAALEVQSLKLEIAGSGDIKASGKANQAHYKIAGSGSVIAPTVMTQGLKVSVAGSGDVAAHSAGSAEIEIIGSGDVTVSGGAKCRVEKIGSGNARCS